MKAADIVGDPCGCPSCHQAGLTEKQPPRRDPKTGAWMHGYELRSWYEARAKFFGLWKEHGPKSMDDSRTPQRTRGARG